jgi:hypothetical protein
MPAVADAALRLHGSWRQAVTYACRVTASEHRSSRRSAPTSPTSRTAAISPRSPSSSRAKLAGEARVPVDARRVYAAC